MYSNLDTNTTECPGSCSCETPAGSLAGMFFAGMVIGILVCLLAAAFLWKYKFWKRQSLFSIEGGKVVRKEPPRILNNPEETVMERPAEGSYFQPSLKYEHIGFSNAETSQKTYEPLQTNDQTGESRELRLPKTGTQGSLYVYQDPQSVSSLLKVNKSRGDIGIRRSPKAGLKLGEANNHLDSSNDSDNNKVISRSAVPVTDAPNQYFVLEDVENNDQEKEVSILEDGRDLSTESNPPNEYFVLESSDNRDLEQKQTTSLSGEQDVQGNSCHVPEHLNLEEHSAKDTWNSSHEENIQEYFVLEKPEKSRREVENNSNDRNNHKAECRRTGSSDDPAEITIGDSKESMENGGKDSEETPKDKFHRAIDGRAKAKKMKIKNPVSNSQEIHDDSVKCDSTTVCRNKNPEMDKDIGRDKAFKSPPSVQDCYENHMEAKDWQSKTHEPIREPTYANFKASENSFTEENRKGFDHSRKSDDIISQNAADFHLKRSPTYENVQK